MKLFSKIVGMDVHNAIIAVSMNLTTVIFVVALLFVALLSPEVAAKADDDGQVGTQTLAQPHLRRQRQMLIGRLQCLQRMGLANEISPGTWRMKGVAETTLRSMGERGDLLHTMQRELAVFDPAESNAVIGRVAGKGVTDELNNRCHLIVDGFDGRAHYLTLAPEAGLGQYPMNAVV